MLKIVVKCTILASALTLFGLQINDVVTKYIDQKTTIAMREDTPEDLYFPGLTIYPKTRFKYHRMKEFGFKHNYEFAFKHIPLWNGTNAYLESTYILGRDFNITVNGIAPKVENGLIKVEPGNKRFLVLIHETISAYRGIYYTLDFKTSRAKHKHYYVIVELANSGQKDAPNEFEAYLSDPMERYGLLFGGFSTLNGIELELNAHNMLHVAVYKTMWKTLPTGKEKRCQTYGKDDSKDKCHFTTMSDSFKKNVNANCTKPCTSPPYVTLTSLGSKKITELCQTQEEYDCMLNNYRLTWGLKYECLSSCTRLDYKTKSHQSMTDNKKNYNSTIFSLYFTFGSEKVHIYEELLLFDFSSFVGNVGGSLGLFVGFSYLDFANKMTTLIMNHVTRNNNKIMV